MRATLEDFKTGWYGLSLELSSKEIDSLVSALRKIQKSGDHFHYRSDFDGVPGIGDIEISCSGADKCDSLLIDSSSPIYLDEPDS